MEQQKEKIAVILFNLGGPDSLKAVKPFLFNLFYDPAIIALKNPLRWIVAKIISSKRAPIAQEIYKLIGNKSPILEETEKQARALEQKLSETDNKEYQCFIAMRYWHPFSHETIKKVQDYNPDKIILLPLYPHYSITTTGSSLIDWNKKALATGLNTAFRVVKDYPVAEGFIKAHVKNIEGALSGLKQAETYRILFSAHGLPEKIIESGDPYRNHIEQTCHKIQERLNHPDYVICYQSRVGPLKWIEPYTEDEIERAGKDGKNIIIVPVAFVSEHSETLVELDIEYKELAEKAGVKDYIRIPALGCHPDYISALAKLTRDAFQ